VDDENVYALAARISVRTQSYEVVDVVFKSGLLPCPHLSLSFVQMVNEIPHKVRETRFVKATLESFLNKTDRLAVFHG
jgi:hypothetical protein